MHKPHTRFVQLGFRRYSTRKSSVFLCGWILCNMSRLILEAKEYIFYMSYTIIRYLFLHFNWNFPTYLHGRSSFFLLPKLSCMCTLYSVVPQSRLSEVSSFVQERDPIKLSKDRSIKELPSISLEGEYGCTLESTSSSWGDEPNE